jgi:hypothetical protein
MYVSLSSDSIVETDKSQQGWESSKAKKYFEKQRAKADKADDRDQNHFFHMMCKLGSELQQDTQALTPRLTRAEPLQVLDICMAPGGYTASVLAITPGAKACGLSLPEELGGHKLHLKPGLAKVEYLDVTMLIAEYSDSPVPPAYPRPELFSSRRPFLHSKFDLIFCDGQVLRTHEPYREKYREIYEPLRLKASQLILALQRIHNGGNLIVLLHEVDEWRSVELLYQLSKFSDVALWKSKNHHQLRSSFYVIAKHVKVDSQAAKDTLQTWRKAWWQSTFGGDDGTGENPVWAEEGYVTDVLNQFGDDLVEMGRPIWAIQREALIKAPWKKKKRKCSEKAKEENLGGHVTV